MKYIKQLSVIFVITFISEVMNNAIPLPVPASIYGMVILFVALQTKLLKIEHVKDAGKFLIDIMPLLFIPAAVGLMDTWQALQGTWVQIIITVVATTIIVMSVSGMLTQYMIRREANKKG